MDNGKKSEKVEKVKNANDIAASVAKKIAAAFIFFVLIGILSSSLVVTYPDEYQLIRRFGEVVRVTTEPGLSFKIPVIDSATPLPNEMLIYDLPESDVITSDKKTMIVDSYVLWHITDPLLFVQSLNGSTQNAEARINTTVYNATKVVISSMTQNEVIQSRDGKLDISLAEPTDEESVSSNDITVDTPETVEIKSLTELIMAQINSKETQYGIVIDTVDVKKLDLPESNKEAVYTRMISERENIAAQYTAEGEEEAQMIINTTDRETSILKSTASAQAEILIAEGEAEYMDILSDAYSDPEKAEFYAFVRSLDALKASMKGSKDKTVILSADSPIARIFYTGQ
ncbi:MAG: protease modulator HflC [Lachnospiraceae bacterium]|nr:protease modulator HflC [Lachnospiraceae bacterium]